MYCKPISWLSHCLSVPIKTCVNIYIIMMKNLDDEGGLEVEFSSEHSTAKRMPATLVNKCIVTVQSPGKTKRIRKRNFLYQFLTVSFAFRWIYILLPVNGVIYYKRSIVFEALTKCSFDCFSKFVWCCFNSFRYAIWDSLSNGL